MGIRLLLVAADEKIRSEYVRVITALGVELDSVHSVAEITGRLMETPYNGILLDVPTLVRANTAEKAVVHDIIQTFPTVRLRWDSRSGTIRTLLFGQSDEGETTIGNFIVTQCATFRERTIRINDRIDVNCCLLLSRNEQFSDDGTIRTITANISRGGCFVFTADRWQNLDLAWLRFADIEPVEPVQVEVRWYKPWGKGLGIPGIGVRYLDMGKEQLAAIGRLVGSASLMG